MLIKATHHQGIYNQTLLEPWFVLAWMPGDWILEGQTHLYRMDWSYDTPIENLEFQLLMNVFSLKKWTSIIALNIHGWRQCTSFF